MLTDADIRHVLSCAGVPSNRVEEIVLAYRRVQRFAPPWPEPRDTAEARKLADQREQHELAWIALLELIGART